MAKSKNKVVFFCKECGYESAKWLGQCPACKVWDSFVEQKIEPTTNAIGIIKNVNPLKESKVVELSKVKSTSEERVFTHINELDRVLGGGIVTGSLVLVGGDPGIGKSTLLLQMCKKLSDDNRKVLYVSGEESVNQIKLRASRLGEFKGEVLLLSETNLTTIQEDIAIVKPEIMIIDSIQTMYKEDISSTPGSASQVKEATTLLMHIAKDIGITTFIVGHVTKDGTVAGPKMLEHMVDTVLYFEGEDQVSYRILRAVKNRFGSTNEIGVFEMKKNGLEEVSNPSEYMLQGKVKGESGSVITCAMEGTRPILVEIQALVCRTSFNFPKRTSAGIDYNRVNLLLAVLEKRIGLKVAECDAYINIAGGMKINEPSVDLAVIMAIVSSYRNMVIDEKTLIFGEVGLTGEVRGVTQAQTRVAEAEKMGFSVVIMPKVNIKGINSNIKLIGVSTVREVIGLFVSN